MDEGTADLPVGFRVDAEEPALDGVRCGQRAPNVVDRGVDRHRVARRDVRHGSPFRCARVWDDQMLPSSVRAAVPSRLATVSSDVTASSWATPRPIAADTN